MERATTVLKKLDYLPNLDAEIPPGHPHIEPYTHPEWLPVELHSKLVSQQGAMQVDIAQIWAEAVPLAIEGVRTQGLCPEHLLIHLALHSIITHQFEQGLRTICDVQELLLALPLDWEKLIVQSRAWGCARQVYLMLRLTNELYGEIVPPEILQRLSAQAIEAHLLAYSLDNLRSTSVAGLKESSGLADAWQERGWWQRWRRILGRLFPTPATIADAYALRPGDWRLWFYYPHWQFRLIHRHLRTGWHLLLADPTTREQALIELTRRDLLAWVTKG
jgi:hypothetical protein